MSRELRSLAQLLPLLPKAELHVHLRGAMPRAVLAELLQRHDLPRTLTAVPTERQVILAGYDNLRPFVTGAGPWAPAETEGLFRYRDFLNFLYTFNFTGLLFHTADDLRLLIHGVLDSLIEQHVVYVELCISAHEYVQRGIAFLDIVTCLEEATRHPGIRVQWIVDLVRDFGPELARRQLREIIARSSPAIMGITLGGSEDCYPHAAFREVYAEARRVGLRCSVHAGEALGPRSVWEALEELAPERIGHGVRAAEDPSLVAHLAAQRIPLEVCPTSNIFTGLYPSYEAHPLPRLMAAGVPTTVNSDDPTFFGTSLTEEYAHLLELGFVEGEMLELVRNGFRYAFLPAQEREAYLRQVEEAWQELAE